MKYYQRSSISMFVNSVIKKQLRKGTFTVPYSWSFANEIERQSGSGNRSYSDVPPDSSGSKEDIVKKSQRIEDNPFYNRYADKIKRVVDQEGRNISERIDKNIQLIDSMNKIPEPERIKTKPKSKSGREESTDKIGGFPGNKCLKDLVNLNMLLKLDAESIAQVWNQHHKSKENCIFSVIPVEKYRIIYENGRQYPSFIYLLPKDNVNKDQAKPDECYQIFLGQFSNHQVHFTSLASYHLRQENATSEMTMWHFPELSGEKGIVLMHGSFDDKKLNSIEAQCLANQLQIYYDGRDLTKSLLLHKFNKAPDSFDYLDAIQEFEKGLL